MPTNQLFESLQAPALRLGDKLSVCVLQCVDQTHSAINLHWSDGTARKMHFIFFKDWRGRKIRFDSESHLQRVCEIVESGYHHAFQNLFLGETKSFKLDQRPLTGNVQTTRSPI